MSKYLHLLQDTVETGRLASARSSGDVEAAGETLQHLLLQERPDGRPLGLPGQEPLGDGGVERLLHALKPRLWRRNGEEVRDRRPEPRSVLTSTKDQRHSLSANRRTTGGFLSEF